MGFDTYLNLHEPLNSVWFDGRNVTVYPSGKVVDRDTGYVVREGNFHDPHIDVSPVRVVNSSNVSNNNNSLLFFIFGLVAIVAIVAVSSNGKR